MSTTTNILANGHSSTIVSLLSPRVKTNYFNREETVDQPDIFDPAFVEGENDFLRLLQLFKTSGITSTVFYQFIPAGNLAYKEKLILQFSLTKQYAAYFPLLRGLLGFGRVAGLSVSTHALVRTFEVEIHSRSAKQVLPYFENIFSELWSEIKFKTALKKVMLVDEQVKKIQQESLSGLYQNLA